MRKHDRRVVHVHTDRRGATVLCGATGVILAVDASDVEESTCQECRSHVPKRHWYGVRQSRMTRQERLEGLADSGCDTWAEYRGER